jgi:cytochrome P450
MFALAGQCTRRDMFSVPNLIDMAHSYNHFISRRFYRYVNLLADTAKSGKPADLGFHMWTTAVGLSAEMLFGVHNDEAYTKHISESELLIFRQRTIGRPLHDYIPAVNFGEKVLQIGALRPMWKLLNVADWVDDFNKAEETAKALRDTEAAYCKHGIRELHERIERGDATPSQLGDLVRVYGTMLTPADEFRAATSLVGSGMGMGTLMAWIAPLLAARPDMQEKAYSAIKEIYGGEAPDPLDTDRVDYIRALATETGRYYVTARLGFSRETTEESEVEGVKIPAGVLVMQNSYWINRDPERYDNPEEFLPERWMSGHYGRMDGKAVKMGVPHMNHGAGRRYCVGIPCTHLRSPVATALVLTLHIDVAKILYGMMVLLLHHFKLERGPLDEEAKEKVFLAERKVREMTMDVDPIEDQVSECDPQSIPLMAGIKLIPRDPASLEHWLTDAPSFLDQFDQPDLSIKAAGEA